MESFKLDDSGDLVMVDGELQLTSGNDEIIQTFKILMETNKNEWFLDYEMGFDYSIINGVKRIDEDALYFALNDVADQMEEVDRVEDVEVKHERQTRKSTITCKVITVDEGELTFEGVF